MTTPRHKSRTGFTLVELLIAITVIAILAGMIAPAVMRALTTAKEFAVIAEMKQIELGLEQFNTDHGFYPPTFGPGREIATVGQLQRYLAKISPQNAEGTTSFANTPATESRLQTWWNNVGSGLDETTSLQFWLTGMSKNKQFPLTGGVSVDAAGDGSASAGTMTICAFNANKYSDGTDFPATVSVERNNYFEFKTEQILVVGGGSAARYLQAFGDQDEDLAYRYLDYKSYPGNAYHDGTATVTLLEGAPQYLNPTSYQLVTFGGDGLSGAVPDPLMNGVDITTGNSSSVDNLCNFTEGRLEKYGN